ncbi:MAG: hypothetical protein AAGK97_16880, partial [Bacteroidota bacterium]
GTEAVFSFTLMDNTTIQASLSEMNEDLDLFLLNNACVPDTCLASSTKLGMTNELLIKALPAGEYYLVVDGKQSAVGDFTLSLECLDFFSASQLDNDAYVDLNWNLDKASCIPQDTGIIVKLIDATNTTLFEQEFTTAALTPDVISGSFRHYLGPNQSRNYVVRVFNRLSNVKVCEEFALGSTTPFAMPEIVEISNGSEPDSIRVVWRNLSKLSDQFRLYRDGVQIENLTNGYTEDSLIVSYVDVHTVNNLTSIQPLEQYNYCIETFSTVFNQSYAQVCGNGSLFDIGFTASDGFPNNKVELTWNDVSAFGSKIRILRNGLPLTTLSSIETSFTDESPIHGLAAIYALSLEENGFTKIVVQDTGFVPSNGMISGGVYTQDG